MKCEKYTPFALFTHERCRDVAILPTQASPELCLEETLSQNEDAVQEETPSEEVVNNPEEVEQPAEESGSEEEVEAPEVDAEATPDGDEDSEESDSADEELEIETDDSVNTEPEEEDPLFLSPEDDEGEVFEATGSKPVIEVLDAPPVKDAKDERIEELERRLAELEERVSANDEEITGLQRERDDLKARLLRSAADMDNFRKRKEREKEELRKYGSDKIVSDLLPAVDNLERALEHAEKTAEESSISDGVRMVHRQLISSLEKHGIQSFESVGEKFDPQRHEAIQQIETTEFDTNVVMQEFQKGYFIHDRLLRPALTVVAKRIDPPPAEVEPEPEAEVEPEATPESTPKEDAPAPEEDAATEQDDASFEEPSVDAGLGGETSQAQA